MVVERGLARCPRCVSVADYVFIETATGRAGDRGAGLRYEVRCRKCGECYGEDSRPIPNLPATVAEPPISWPRDREPVEPRDWRREIRGVLSAAAQQGREAAQRGGVVAQRGRVAAQRGRDEIDGVVRRTRLFVQERRSRQKDDQTGG